MATDSPIPPDRAVVDRVADGQAALLVGAEETECVVPAGALPKGAKAGDWVIVEKAPEGAPTVIGVDAELTASRRRAARSRMARLRQQRPSRRLDR